MKKRSRRRRKRGRLIPYIVVLLLGAAIIAAVLYYAGKNTLKPQETETDPVESDTEEQTNGLIEIESETEETESSEAEIEAVDQVNVDQLIDRYYEAKINDDADELNKIVDTETPYNKADLVDETQFISKYDNFKTYVMPGLTEDYFIVYVKYDIYFNGISTGAPALNHFVVAKDADGYYYIYNKEVSGEFQSYLEETEQSETVTSLKAQVEDELKAACESNEDLKYLISMLTGEEPESTAEEPVQDYDGTTKPAEETDPENPDPSEIFETQEFNENGNS